MTAQDVQFQIDSLKTKAESGADWAEICRLEDVRLTLKAQEKTNGQAA